MKALRLLVLMTACVLVLSTGCAKRAPVASAAAPPPPTVDEAPPAPPAPPPPPADVAEAPVASAVLTADELFARKTVEELNAERPLRDALFNVDEATLREDARAVLQANADWLRRWASTRVTIEGHADERGTPEYNLALGERRASAVRSYLVSLGVEASRLRTVSKGREEPVCVEAQESCWQQNRRGYSIITGK